MYLNNHKQPEKERHHYLFYIFQKDKEKNPMPDGKAKKLLELLHNNIKKK